MINRFANSDMHRFPVERNEDGTEYRGGSFFDPLPDETGWGVIVGEILHNLRSGLNGLIWQLVLINGQEPGRDTEFPIFNDRERFASIAGPKIRGVRDDVRTHIEGLQPFNLGPEKANRARLWLLHDLNIRDKHHLVLPVVTALANWGSTQPPRGIKIELSRAIQHGTATIRITSERPTEKMDVKFRLAYSVSLDIGGTPHEIGQFLFDLGEETEKVVQLFIGEFS